MVNFLLDVGVIICVLFLSTIAELIIMLIASINSDDSMGYTIRYPLYHVIIATILICRLVMR